MSGSKHLSRRDFIKTVSAAVGGFIGLSIGIPSVGYLLSPALRENVAGKPVAIGNLQDIPVGKPYPFSFTITRVNGWERTASSFSGFVLRKTEQEMVVLSSRCTHLSCRVTWSDEAAGYLCPCHDAMFDIEGKVVNGPPPEPLGHYEYEIAEDGTVFITPVEVHSEA
jgi:menaquinol-cytochrome c reductase iron-sulfur subunit